MHEEEAMAPRGGHLLNRIYDRQCPGLSGKSEVWPRLCFREVAWGGP